MRDKVNKPVLSPTLLADSALLVAFKCKVSQHLTGQM